MTKHISIGRRLVIPAVIAAVVFTADQLSKAWVLQTWPEPYSGSYTLIPHWLELIYIQNTGVAFGLFTGIPQVFTITSLLIVAGAIWMYLRHAEEHSAWLAVCLGLIIGGAIGNVVDRIRFGYVVDFIKALGDFFPWIFNLADASIVVGVLLMALILGQSGERPATRAKVYAAPHVEADDGS